MEDTLRIHQVKDTVLQLVQFLESNISVVESMGRGMRKIAGYGKYGINEEDPTFHRTMEIVESHVIELRQQRDRAKTLIRRADAIETLVQLLRISSISSR